MLSDIKMSILGKRDRRNVWFYKMFTINNYYNFTVFGLLEDIKCSKLNVRFNIANCDLHHFFYKE